MIDIWTYRQAKILVIIVVFTLCTNMNVQAISEPEPLPILINPDGEGQYQLISAEDFSKSTILVKLYETPEQHKELFERGPVLFPDSQRDKYNTPFEKRLKSKKWLLRKAELGFNEDGYRRHDQLNPTLYTLRLVSGMTPQKAIFDIKKDPALKGIVKFVEENALAQIASVPNDEYFDQQSNLLGIHVPDVWDLYPPISTGTKLPLVAVVDTGMDIQHVDLETVRYENPLEVANGENGLDDDGNGFVDDFYGWNFVSHEAGGQSNVIIDKNGHGTNMSGVMGAAGNNYYGIAGINWYSNLLTVRAFDSSGKATISDIIDAIEYSRFQGADIINASWTTGSLSEILRASFEACEYLGILVVASVGNGLLDFNKISFTPYPAGYDFSNIISVGSASIGFGDSYLDLDSPFGSSVVDIGAPGNFVFTTSPYHSFGCPSYPCPHYTYVSGSSIAAAQVTGVASLIKLIEPTLDGQELRARIVSHGITLPWFKFAYSTSAQVDAKNAIFSIESDPIEPDPDESAWIKYCRDPKTPFKQSGQYFVSLIPCPLKSDGSLKKIKSPIFKSPNKKHFFNSDTYVYNVIVPQAKYVRYHISKANLRSNIDLQDTLYFEGSYPPHGSHPLDFLRGKAKDFISYYAHNSSSWVSMIFETGGEPGSFNPKKDKISSFTLDYVEAILE